MLKRDELTNPNSCMSRARPDEMTFVLLARDASAAATIRYWVQHRICLGKNSLGDAQIVEALACADTMDKQRAERPPAATEGDACLDCGRGYWAHLQHPIDSDLAKGQGLESHPYRPPVTSERKEVMPTESAGRQNSNAVSVTPASPSRDGEAGQPTREMAVEFLMNRGLPLILPSVNHSGGEYHHDLPELLTTYLWDFLQKRTEGRKEEGRQAGEGAGFDSPATLVEASRTKTAAPNPFDLLSLLRDDGWMVKVTLPAEANSLREVQFQKKKAAQTVEELGWSLPQKRAQSGPLQPQSSESTSEQKSCSKPRIPGPADMPCGLEDGHTGICIPVYMLNLELELKAHAARIRNQKTEINRLGELHANASRLIESQRQQLATARTEAETAKYSGASVRNQTRELLREISHVEWVDSKWLQSKLESMLTKETK